MRRNRVTPTVQATAIFMAAFLFLSARSDAGRNTGADFLKIPIGAEPSAMGQAYTALAQGINALNWNPAGIVSMPSYLNSPTIGVSLSHQAQFSDDNLDHLGLITPSGRNNAFGIDLIRLSYADQELRNADRQRTGTFTAADTAFGAAYAHDFGRMQIGTQLKLIRQELAGNQADGVAVDLGLLSTTPNPRLSVGFAVRNLGPSMQLVTEKYSLPLTLSMGTAYRVSKPLTLACDLHYKPAQKQTVLAIGSQIFATSNISLRAGYMATLAQALANNQKSETTRGDFANIAGLTGGLGLQFRQFNLDYSITPFGELGNTQMLTLSTWFGDKGEQEPTFATPEPKQPPSDRLILILPENNEQWWNDLHP